MEFQVRSCFLPTMALFIFLIFMSLCTQKAETSVSDTWESLKNSDAVQQARKEWSRARTKTQSFINKVSNGKLAEDITTYIDNTLMKLFSIRVSELQKTLKKAQQTWLGPALMGLWLLLGYVTLKLTSCTTFLVVMSTTVLIHSIYGSVVVFTQVVVFIGLCMYIASLIANNVVLCAVTILTFYVSYSVFGVCRRPYSQGVLYDLEDRVTDLSQRTAGMESKMVGLEQKIDLLLEGRE
ncbi:uncharacterized protein LOC110978725 [Acanthaster planci]|uniref:Uncharacterized protein LOC110978725 n=1 Tax=Acanthaster planci TaxID=133434 RepID=A0A8B7Y8T5_ACAPL|nr:uncharacterized protein LOC110978725 [Acanthaster planci]